MFLHPSEHLETAIKYNNLLSAGYKESIERQKGKDGKTAPAIK